MSFADIIGHQKQFGILRAGLASERLHHAYLFVGPEGVGKRTIAMALTKAIHCQNGTTDFCGECVNCARIAGGNHPDVRAVVPLSDKKEIGIPQIREIERDLGYRSFTGKRKIVIIDPATLLNIAAQNALLKTLEEPPQESLIILIATSVGALLPTLRSRCLRLSFAPLSRREVADYLQKTHNKSAKEAGFLAAISLGSVGVALGLDTAALTERRQTWINMLGAIEGGNFYAAIAAADDLSANRDEALGFFKWAESWYRDLMVYRATGAADELVNLDMRAEVERQAARRSTEEIAQTVADALDAGAAIQRNLNRRMVLEKFLFSAAGERR
jgi:DNA polymerase-3 subunit delta'